MRNSNVKVKLNQRLQESFKHNSDFIQKSYQIGSTNIDIFYLSTITDTKMFYSDIIEPSVSQDSSKVFKNKLSATEGFSFKEQPTIEASVQDILRGHMVILSDQWAGVFDCTLYKTLPLTETKVEKTIVGPQTGFSEDIDININLIRHRYHNNGLKIKDVSPKDQTTKMRLKILYDDNKVAPDLLDKLYEEMQSIQKDKFFQTAEELNQRIIEKNKNIFPTIMISERPDRIAYNIYKGKVVVLVEGSPFALIIPSTFMDFFSSMSDFYQPYWVSRFLKILRYLGLAISTTLPAAYVGFTSYNPELFKVELALSIAGSRAPVPYPSFVEVFLMLIMMEMLTEASIRLPKTIGPTATTVGGLILGQAATEAGLVSNIMIIIVASVAISNFVIPINQMSFAMRLEKYYLLLLTAVTGLIGLIVGLMSIILYLTHLSSMGNPYFKLTFSETPNYLKKGTYK
ncbi:spore germination protein [Pontibacillus marinus]|uniref:spore germination protein n=1 Tax=Pontibacillus marinus TaxID=273164 RepID=UPI00042058E5|nr:spore germination protein [Pontibacillus marinus]